MNFSETHAFSTPEDNTTNPNHHKRRRGLFIGAAASLVGGAAIAGITLTSHHSEENEATQETNRKMINESALDAASAVLSILSDSRAVNNFPLTQEDYDTGISNARIIQGLDGKRPSADDPVLSQATADYDKATESLHFTATKIDEPGNRDSEFTKINIHLHVNEGNPIAGSDSPLNLSMFQEALSDRSSLEVKEVSVYDGDPSHIVTKETLEDANKLNRAANTLPSALEQAKASLLDNTQ